MNRVLLVSDSHGLTKVLNELYNRHGGVVDAFIHCGDSELPFDSQQLTPFNKVGGNCDLDARFPNELNLSVGEINFFVTHGHLHQVKTTLMPLSYRAEELGANVICFGHSHIAGAEKVGEQLFINPGSIRLPRMRKEKTFAILSWDTLAHIVVEFFDSFGEKIDGLTYETDLTA